MSSFCLCLEDTERYIKMIWKWKCNWSMTVSWSEACVLLWSGPPAPTLMICHFTDQRFGVLRSLQWITPSIRLRMLQQDMTHSLTPSPWGGEGVWVGVKHFWPCSFIARARQRRGRPPVRNGILHPSKSLMEFSSWSRSVQTWFLLLLCGDHNRNLEFCCDFPGDRLQDILKINVFNLLPPRLILLLWSWGLTRCRSPAQRE